ncbi:MAG: 50S ribosomal protein L7Ae [Thermoproteota archaeon]
MGRIATADYDAPKELVESACEVLKVASESGKVKRGTNESTKAVERGLAKLVFIAEDTDPLEIVLHLPLLCKDRGIPYIVIPEKKLLGSYVDLMVPTSAACIIDPGRAEKELESVIQKIKALRK